MKTSSLGFTLLELFVVLTVIAILVSLALPLIINPAREASRKHACSDNIRRMGLAMLEYEQTYKRLTSLNCTWGYGGYGGIEFWNVPSTYGGAGRWSGIIALLPYLNEAPLSMAFGAQTSGMWEAKKVCWGPYGSIATPQQANALSSNLDVLRYAWSAQYKPNRIQVGVFRCPSDPGRMRPGSQRNLARTNYAFCMGDVQVGINSGDPAVEQARGAFQMNKHYSLSDIVDGVTDTVMFGEVATAETSSFYRTDQGAIEKDAKVQGRAVYELDLKEKSKGIDILACRSLAVGGRYLGTKRNWGHRGTRAYDALPAYTAFNTVNPPNAGSCTPTSNAWGEGEGIYTASSYHLGGAHVVTFAGNVIFIHEVINTSDNRVGATPDDYYSPSLTWKNNAWQKSPNWTTASPFGPWGAMGTRSSWDYQIR